MILSCFTVFLCFALYHFSGYFYSLKLEEGLVSYRFSVNKRQVGDMGESVSGRPHRILLGYSYTTICCLVAKLCLTLLQPQGL